jgi:NAD(P)-dependent dehydrogenase (short-subunit alcohol dehydrogenase family)
LVAGATRGAGRGIARELAAAGAKVWCTGRSTRGAPAVAALAADPQVRRKAGGAYSASDLADEYGFTDLDGSRPNFWRDVLARIAPELGNAGELPPRALRLAAARYQKIHLSPAHSAEAHALRERLGWSRLPAALQPITLGG